MTDMRRTLLWVVFTMSLVLLWDAWNKHTGQPTIFGGGARPVAAAGSAPLPASAPGVPAPAALPSVAGVPGAAAAVPAAVGAVVAPPVAPAQSEQVVLTTDTVKATFDTVGGSMVRLELLAYRDGNDATRKVVLFEQSAKRLYAAQSGLISTQAGLTLPNHFSQMSVEPGERTLSPTAKEISVRFLSPVTDGVQLVKTYTLKRGEYTVDVRHEIINQGAAVIKPQLYLQLARDGNPPEEIGRASCRERV